MTLSAWLSVAAICVLGAMSPGPSLAVVVRNTIAGSRAQGVYAAVGHGVGIGVYAFLTAAGLAVLIAQSPALFEGLRWGGAVFLVFLGVQALISRKPGPAGDPALGDVAGTANARTRTAPRYRALRGARDGFLIAFLNPKVALFFVALFSQFVRPDAGWGEKLGLTALAAGIDALWFSLVAIALSRSEILERLRARAIAINRITGVLLIAVAVRVVL